MADFQPSSTLDWFEASNACSVQPKKDTIHEDFFTKE